ncbi:MAG: hypothetical protein HFH76_02755 [Lachnospiraceae bacterium]|nr:hypothetical protein [Lachnospiraceae bacterium]
MIMTMDKERFVTLYGGRFEAEQFLYQNRRLINSISYCIFDDCEETMCHGIPVYDDSVLKHKMQELILVTVADEKQYINIKKSLESIGKKEFENFIWSKAYNKKIVVVNANCHGDALVSYLMLSERFRAEYFVYPVPQIHENGERSISEVLLSNANVYIHQDIRKNNSVSENLSDEIIEQSLNKETLNITIPNLVGMGNWMFPALKELDRTIKTKEEIIYILYRDEILDDAACRRNGTVSEYARYWRCFRYDGRVLDELWNMNKAKLIAREKNWDIKISEFIYENYKSVPCFVDANHPSKYLMKEIGRQTAAIMNITDICDEHYESNMGIPIPILPSVKEYFGLNFTVPAERKEDYFGKCCEDTALDIEAYVQAYIWWYHDRII